MIRDPTATPAVPAPASPIVTTVASIAALKALAGTDITGTVEVLSRTASAIPDQLGTFYTWNSTDTRSDDSATTCMVIQPDSGGVGRWNPTLPLPTSFMLTVLDDATAAVARTTLGTDLATNVNFTQSGVGAVPRTVQDKERDIVSVFDWFSQAQIADVRARTALLDVTTPLNTAYEEASNGRFALHMPAGVYKITDTLWATPEGSVFQSAHILGAGGGSAIDLAQTVIDASAITAKPAMNIQKCRGVYVGHLQIKGCGEYLEVNMPVQNMLYDSADWVDPATRDSRYSPYCGIALDAGLGPVPPDGGYSGFTYQNTGGGSANVVLDNVSINRFVVGFMHNPDTTTTQGDNVTLIEPYISNTKVAIAIGQAQARAVRVRGGNLGWCRSCVDSAEYGQRTGTFPLMEGTQYGPAFECFSHSGLGQMTVIGGRSESVHRIGFMAGLEPAVFIGFDTDLLSESVYGKRCPIVFQHESGPFYWSGGLLNDGSSTAKSYFIIAEKAVLESMNFYMENRFRPYIGGQLDFGTNVMLKNCRVIQVGTPQSYGTEQRIYALPARICAHWSEGFFRDRSTLYNYVPSAAQDNYISIGVMSNIAFTATTLTFDNTDAAGGIMVGDLIMWKFPAIGKSTNEFIGPAAKVTSVAAPTVTCDLLYARSYYDEAYAPANTAVVVNEWAPGQALTGDTHSNTTLDNISPTTILQNGDWITAAAGIPANTRVVSGGGTASVVLSRAATDTAAGKTLYWGRLHSVDSTVAF